MNGVRKWVHKETKAVVKATPWWEVPEPIFCNKSIKNMLPDLKDHKWRIGVLIQVGWLLMNEQKVWFGVGLTVSDVFEDVGPWIESKKKVKVSKKK